MEIVDTKYSESLIKFLAEDDEKIPDFEAKSGKTTVRYNGDNIVVYAGLGKDRSDISAFKDACANAVREINKLKHEEVEIVLPQKSVEFAGAAVEAAVLADYSYDKYMSEKKTHIKVLHIDYEELQKLKEVKIIAESVNYARDLINENAAIVTPEFLDDEAERISEANEKIEIEILDEVQIQKKGLGLLYAVGKGSATPPRLIIAKYTGDSSSEEYTAIIGKGMTFDSGGLNLKPSGSIETMRHDMSGAATCLALLNICAQLNPQINFIVAIPAAQSAIGKDAYFVGDVYESYSKKTVEVLNTDAEGRLILADAMSYIIKHYNPKQIVDIATLTGAIVIALGNTIAGMFSNNDELSQKLIDSSKKTGENIWRMPIRDEHREAIKSDIADVLNTSTLKRGANSITAATFLEYFTENTPWCHLDIAGTSWNDGVAKGITPKFATGFGVRLLWEFLTNS